MHADAPAEHKQRAVQHQRDVIDRTRQRDGGLLEQLLRRAIAGACTIEYLCCTQILWRFAIRSLAIFSPLRSDSFSPDYALQRSGLTAICREVWRTGHEHIADLARSPVCSAKRQAI